MKQRRRSNQSASTQSKRENNAAQGLQASYLTGGALNLVTIPENGKNPRKELDMEVIKRFKEHLYNKDFFFKLKLILVDLNRELEMTRGGGAISDEFIQLREKDICDDQTFQLIKHDPDFRQYCEENQMKMLSVVNKTGQFDGTGFYKPKKLFYKYPSLESIKKTSRKIRHHQDTAIFKAYE